MNRTELLKTLDNRIGAHLAGLLSGLLPHQSAKATQNAPQRILLIRPGGIGDAALLAPSLLALRQHWPDAHLDVLAERRNAAVFDLCPSVAQCYCYDQPADWLRFTRLRYDLIIDSEQSHYLSALVARLLPAACRCGFASNSRARLFAVPVSYDQADYEIDSFYHLLDALAIPRPPQPAIPFLQIPAAAAAQARPFLPPEASYPLIALFPGASIFEKRWPAKHFGQLVQQGSAQGWRFVVVGGPQDRPAADAIAADNRVVNLAGRLQLAATAAVLQRCAALVTGDSGLLHLAVGLGTPTVSLFGTSSTKKWAPPSFPHCVINHRLPCSPCSVFGSTPPCPYQARCIQEITAEEVFQALTDLLAKRQTAGTSARHLSSRLTVAYLASNSDWTSSYTRSQLCPSA
ncbi:glycosyltransferase family 9 protein [Desulfuromonas thiophila]|uniref:glycosyltransferase family 9 protein n=1 Tax=Desulfuromonas thiophila TaxID=57664 RepID=UPI0024A98771|nr:glycosyltransferase family 9 protein [Desulfuromonas thiophila]